MGAVLLVQMDEALARALVHVRTPAEDFTFEEIGAAAVERRLVAGGLPVDALILGPATDHPLRIAQHVGTRDRAVPVLILSTREGQPALQRALQFAPLIGEDVRCAAADDPDAAVSIVGETLNRIRQRKQYQRTLNVLNARLVASPPPPAIGSYLGRLLEYAPIGIVAVDAMGSVQTWNPKAGDILERRERAALGNALLDFFPADTHQQLRELLNDCLAGNAPDGSLILGRRRADGRSQWVEIVGVGLPPGPAESAILILLQDVTERVLAESERAAALAREQAAVRVRDDFLSTAAHELKTPVTSLLLATQMLRHKLERNTIPDPVSLQRAATLVDQQGRKLGRMIDQLLDISHLDTDRINLELAAVDLKQLAEEVVAGFQLQAEKHQIVVEAPESVLVRADSLRIEQILMNLLDNAHKYSPDGGRITVTLEPPAGNWVRLCVADQGLGVPPEHRSRIFERFHQAHATSYQSGMGLGLSISQQIATLHGGYITADFPAGGGAEFCLQLPRDGPE